MNPDKQPSAFALLAALGGPSLVALAIALTAAEFTLRAIDRANVPTLSHPTFQRFDPELIFSLIPNATFAMVGEEFDVEAHTNSHGLRGAEIGSAGASADPGALRVIALGGSHTFGDGVGDEETFAYQLEAILESEGRAVEVLNAGVAGYGTDQSYKRFAIRLRALDPDFVVLALSPTDPSDSLALPLYSLNGDRLVALDVTRHPIFRQGRMFEYVPVFLRDWRLVKLTIPLMAKRGAFVLSEFGVDDPTKWARRKLLAEIRSLAAMGFEDEFRVVLLGIPARSSNPDVYDWLHRADLGDVSFLDLSHDPGWTAGRIAFHFARDPHLTSGGHRYVAERLRAHLGAVGTLRSP